MRIIEKITTIFRGIVILAAVCVCSNAGAYAADLEINHQTVGIGKEITFAVSVTAQNNVNVFGFDILYNEALLKYKAYDKNGSLIQNFDYFEINELLPGQLRIGGFDASGHTIQQNTTGILVVLTFEVIGDGVYELELANLEDGFKNWTTKNGTVDAYEPDDLYTQSGILDRPQYHNFHDPGDADWVWFYGISGETYTIQANQLESRCDAVIEVFGMDGSSRPEWKKDDGGTGTDESLDWTCPGDGIYYVKAKHSDPGIFGGDTAYKLQIIFPRQDAYEIDDTPDNARVITINGEPQRHNFWNEKDADWVKFFGLVGVNYTIQAIEVGSSCNVMIELYDSDQKTVLGLKNDGGKGEDEILNWAFTREGTYYVKATYDSSDKSRRNNLGEDVKFKFHLQVNSTISTFSGDIIGRVINGIDQTSAIKDVNIKTNGEEPNSAMSRPSGGYDISNHVAGTFTLVATKVGYKPYQGIVVVMAETVKTIHDIYMCPCDGDTNSDGEITPGDAKNAFDNFFNICPTSGGIECDKVCCDVNLDGKCTPADTLCIFNKYMDNPSKPSCLDYLDSTDACK